MSRLRLLSVLLLSAIMLATGCATTPEDPGDPGEGEATYWLVQVRGNETRDPAPGHVCDVAYDHRLVPSQQRLAYNNHSYELRDPGYVVAFDAWDTSTQCPVAYQLQEGTEAFTVEIGHYGNVTFDPQADGPIGVTTGSAEHELEAGESFTDTYEASYEDEEGRQVDVSGNLTVEHFGAWPTERLEPE